MARIADLRARKKAVLRDTIVQTAINLFESRGYDSVSVDEIASSSMCSRSTFNRYFGTKEDVLFPGAAEVTTGLATALAAAADASLDRWQVARDSLVDQLESFIQAIDPELWARCARLWLGESAPRRRYLEFAYAWEQVLAAYFQALAPKDPDHVLQSRLLASAMVAAERTAMHAAIHSGADVREIANRVFDQLEAGLGGEALRVKKIQKKRPAKKTAGKP